MDKEKLIQDLIRITGKTETEVRTAVEKVEQQLLQADGFKSIGGIGERVIVRVARGGVDQKKDD